MKSALVLFAFLISSSAFAYTRPIYWEDLSEGQTVELRQEVALADGVRFPVGTELKVTMREALSAPGVSLVYFGLRQVPCAKPQWESGLELVLPEGELDASRSVGVELAKNCQWGIYVETKDLSALAIF